MSIDLSYIRIINKSNGCQSSKEAKIKEFARQYNPVYNNAITEFDLLISSSRANTIYKYPNTIPIKCVVDYKKKWNKSDIPNPFSRELWIYHNLLQVGEVIDFEHKKSKEKKTYILSKRVENEVGYDVFQMLETTHILKWLNSKGDIYSSPVVIESATKYSDGLFENAKIKVGDTQISITFPANENTDQIYIGQRFLLDKKHAYEVSDDGATSPKGLRQMVLTQSQVHEGVDNLDLLIADYTGNAHDYRMEIVNKNVVLTQGDIYKLLASVYDKSVKVENPELVFEVVDKDILSIAADIVTVLKVGNTRVNVKFGDLTDTINITVIAQETNNYTCEIVGGKDSISLNRTVNFAAKFFNNGVLITDTGIWSITNENGGVTDYATITSSTADSCTVKVTSKWIFESDNLPKYFWLHLKGATGQEFIRKIKITT